MTESGAWAGSWTSTAAPPADARPRPRRAAALWALLHAQSQLGGPADAFALAEDDHYRLSRRPEPAPPLGHISVAG